MDTFWKPVKSKPRKLLTKQYWDVKSKVPKMLNLKIYPKRTLKENKLIQKNPYGDKDKDGLMNWYDCKPLNKKKQGWAHQGGMLYYTDRVTKVKMMKPEKFLKTAYNEALIKTQKYQPQNVQKYMPNQETFYNNVLDKNNVNKLKKLMEDSNVKMNIPHIEYNSEGRPIGHEGRHRAMAAVQLGIKLIPVNIVKNSDQIGYGKEVKTLKQLNEFDKWKIKNMKLDEIKEKEHIINQSISSADIPIKEQRQYGVERPEILQKLKFRKGTTPLSEAEHLTVYHGTSEEASENIKKEGLKVKSANKYDVPDTIFVTPNKNVALGYSLMKENNINKEIIQPIDLIEEKGAVLKIKIPRKDVENSFNKYYDRSYFGTSHRNVPLKEILKFQTIFELPIKKDISPEDIKVLNKKEKIKIYVKALTEPGFDLAGKGGFVKIKSLIEPVYEPPYKRNIIKKQENEPIPEALQKLPEKEDYLTTFKYKFYSKKIKEKENEHPKIKSFLNEFSFPIKVVEVSEIRNQANGEKFAGFANFEKKKIVIDKNLKDQDKIETVAHELGHFKLRERGIPESGLVLSKEAQTELEKTKSYMKKKGHYPSNKVAEEIFADYYEQSKSEEPSRIEKHKEKKEKYPALTNEFDNIIENNKNTEDVEEAYKEEKDMAKPQKQEKETNWEKEYGIEDVTPEKEEHEDKVESRELSKEEEKLSKMSAQELIDSV